MYSGEKKPLSERLAELTTTSEQLEGARQALKGEALAFLRRAARHLANVADSVEVNLLVIVNDPHENPLLETTDVVAAQTTDRLQSLVDTGKELVKRSI